MEGTPMKRKRPSNIFSQINVRHQLYIIFFLGIFIPVLALGNYLIFWYQKKDILNFASV